jgi:hypothetical protein
VFSVVVTQIHLQAVIVEMAIAATCVGSLLPRTSFGSPSSAKGLDDLGSLQLVFAGKSAAKVW